MDLKIVKGQIVITSSGIELLKIKASLSRCLGNIAVCTKNGVSFPVACADMVAEKVPEIDALLPKTHTIFTKHSQARMLSLTSLANQDVSQLDNRWNDILDIPQQYAVNAMVTPNLLGLCQFDEQGSGKTVMTIAAFDILKQHGVVDSMVIICPKSMLPGWEGDIKNFLKDNYVTVIAEGNCTKKRTAVLSGFDILISNYEGLKAMLVPLKAITSHKKILLVVDESYYAKNENAERSRNIKDFRDFCFRCFVLCGTPAPNSPYDLVNQFNIADLGYTFASFCPTKNLDDDKETIRNLISSRGTFIRRLKNEILDCVPEKHFHVIPVKLTGCQREMYEKARDALELELRSYDNRKFKRNLASYFQKRSALLQICSIPINIDPTFCEVPDKYRELDTLLSQLFAEKRKVIIWTFYRASIDELSTRYAEYAPLTISGDTSTECRKTAVADFQNNPNRLLLIANPSAAGAGITLHASHDAIYVSYTNQAAHYLQSLDRIHRRGQLSNEVNYYLFVCENTIEESEVTRLRARELQQHELLGDTIAWPTSLDDALAELSAGVTRNF